MLDHMSRSVSERKQAMFCYPKFELSIERCVDAQRLYWPSRGEAGHDSALGCNREYFDVRGFSWKEAQRVFALETELIDRIEKAEDANATYDDIENEMYDDPDGLGGLDIGVASTVVALSAARCVPASSCNGGAYGGNHYEAHPVVAFCARDQAVPLLLECAEATGVGLVSESNGYLVVYADDIRAMRGFAAKLIERSTDFNRLQYARRRKAKDPSGGSQPGLFEPP